MLELARTPDVVILSQLADIVIFVSAGRIDSRIDTAYSTAAFALLQEILNIELLLKLRLYPDFLKNSSGGGIYILFVLFPA